MRGARQTALGVAWIMLQPLLSTVVFTVIFGVLLDVPSNGAPYALFALAALVPWQYFAGSLSRVGTSLDLRQRQPDHQGVLSPADHPALRCDLDAGGFRHRLRPAGSC